ncbi:MAG: glutamate 5-kinase [Acidimicrobiia bacterium]
MRAVVKIGTSSVTNAVGELDESALAKLCDELVAVREAGHPVAVVCSGAIAAGMPALGLAARPTDIGTLQAIAAVGQPRLMARINAQFATHGVVAGQVLLTPYDFLHRTQYLHARETLARLFDLGVIPIVNENDTVADDEVRFGDNDRISALVANLIEAEVLVMLTDTAGLFTADPRVDASASLIEEIAAVDAALDAMVGGAGSDRGSGGMATKLSAARIASWSGVRAVIAAADAPGVIADAIAGRAVGTVIQPHAERLASRKLWIAFAIGASGRIVVDDGARTALLTQGRSLLAAGVREVVGTFEPESAVEIVGPDGRVFAKGLVRSDSVTIRATAGQRTADLPNGVATEVVHRDDLVVLPG